MISGWQRADFGGRKGISADIILACMSGLGLHYDYFFANYDRLALPEERRAVVETPEGPRPAKPGEADATLFPIDLDRVRDNRTRDQVQRLERTVQALQAQVAETNAHNAAQMRQILDAIAEISGRKPPKVGAR